MTYFSSKKSGFTLIELLIATALIGVLASIILANIGDSRAKGRDAKRLSDIRQIQKAVELYYDDHGTYPETPGANTKGGSSSCASSGITGNDSYCQLMLSKLSPYLSSPVIMDPLGAQNDYRYYYDSNFGDNYQTYGIMARMEHSNNYPKASSDGGHYNSSGIYYEIGDQPAYCKNKYPTGTDGNWWGSGPLVCLGGD